MAGILCPYCLKPHDFNASRLCPISNLEVPSAYINEYREVSPLWLAMVGFPQHGKTTYLAALSLLLMRLNPIFPGLYHRELDQFTITNLRTIRQEASEGKQPESTPVAKNVVRPMLLSVYGLPQSGSRCLVMYDVAGQSYKNIGDLEAIVPSLKEVTTTWFLVSLKDLRDSDEQLSITELFNIYLTGMQQMRVNLRDRNLIVVFTKGDTLKYVPEIRNYLISDPLQSLMVTDQVYDKQLGFIYETYLNELGRMSAYLEAYTRQEVPLGAAFINMVRAQGMNLTFCVTSALGDSPDPQSNRMRVNAVRYRVLDPLLWAIRLEQPRQRRPMALVLDADKDSQAIYANHFVMNLWDDLAGRGEVSTYFLGQRQIASLPEQAPPTTPPQNGRLRLIGPILEQLDVATSLIVITTGQILDLNDFRNSKWRDKILLVSIKEEIKEESRSYWPHTFTYRESDTPVQLVNAFFRMNNE